MDEGGAANVDAARRLGGDEKARLEGELAGDRHAVRMAAGEVARGPGRGAMDAREARRGLAQMTADLLRPQERAIAEGWSTMVAGNGVVADGRSQRQALAAAVGADIGK